MSELSFGTAALLGIVEGLTEFIPVSSTGHLIITNSLLGLSGDKITHFSIFIQLGAILSMVVLYWRNFLALIGFGDRLQVPENERFSLFSVALGCLPILSIGYLLHHYITGELFQPRAVAIAFIAGGIFIIAAERFKRNTLTDSPTRMSLKQALGVGLFQVLALWPGMSRSASTIAGGLLSGLDRKLAVQFSFLVSVPVMAIATCYDLLKSWHLLSASDLPLFATGFVFAFLSALIAIKGFLALLGRMTLLPFAIYRIAAGIFILILSN
jgi:undecaprenyl-diphosphatase